MSLDDFRNDLDATWEELDRRFDERKDSHGTVLALTSMYRRMAPEERRLADQVIGEWLVSANSKKRFDALALVDEFAIASALPALRMLEKRYEESSDHDAPFEWAKVNRILGRLQQGSE